ncbi:MAG: excinuclease ABC subunit UvrC [Actinomycetota bacterium]|nr:excinuclease ABC subunit UvrC [Actinomycetota bacterium]
MEDIKIIKDDILKILSHIPKKSGVYLFKDKDARIIYVGKAKSLNSRVRSYFKSRKTLSETNPKAYYFSEKIDSIDYIVTDSEVEAFILEINLIKKYRPKFNSFFRDDKSYPFIAITEEEEFPQFFITRNKKIRGARYFGPYTNVSDLRESVEYISKVFRLRDCKKTKPGKTGNTPCLNYHMKLCSGPCIGEISKDEYRENIKLIISVLSGKNKSLIAKLEKQMINFSKEQEYEKALDAKNKIDFLKGLNNEQKIYINSEYSWDFIGFCQSDDFASINIFMYRNGEFAGYSNFLLDNFEDMNKEEILSDFIVKYYENISNMPSKIYIPFLPESEELIIEFFIKTKNKRINLKVPKSGANKKIMDMVSNNCRLFAEKKKFEKQSNHDKLFNDLIELQGKLALSNIPRRIECYDISNLKESFAVGSMVVFADGYPLNNNYRHFKIKTVKGQDDFAMLQEVLERRLSYLKKSKIYFDESFYMKPDLIIIDGGKGQLSAASEVLEKNKLDKSIDIISIAKKEEIIFCKLHPEGIKINKDNGSMRIVIRLRDEAHRFALQYHRKLRDKNMTFSFFDSVKGIGEKKKAVLYENFNSMEELKNQDVKTLIKIKGITYIDAKNIYDALHK